MQWPLDVPSEFSEAITVKTPEELLKKLIKLSDDHLVRFFEWISHDEIWCAQNIDYLKVIFKWINEEFLRKRFSLQHAKRVVSAIYEHLDVLRNCFFYDVIFDVGPKKLEANSFMAGTSSDVLLALIRRNPKDPIHIKIPDKAKNAAWTVEQVLEFIHTNHIAKLSHYSHEELFAILHKAILWNIPELVEKTSQMLYKYVTTENALDILLEARRERLYGLEKTAIEQLNKIHSGIEFHDKGPEHLAIEVVRMNEESIALFDKLAPSVTYLICKQPNDEMIPLIKKLTLLKGLDLSFSTECTPEFIEAIPPLESLELEQCPWVDFMIIRSLFKQTPQLKKINLSENSQLNHKVFVELVNFPQLISLKLLNCHSIDDEMMLRLGAMCQELKEFYVSHAQKISDEGLSSFSDYAHNLTKLTMIECNKITENGFAEIILNSPRLVELDLHRCDNVTDHVVLQIARSCPELHYLNLENCPHITQDALEKIKQKHPYIKIDV